MACDGFVLPSLVAALSVKRHEPPSLAGDRYLAQNPNVLSRTPMALVTNDLRGCLTR